MKQIPLSQGKVALVDDEDYDYLIQWKWHARKTSYGGFLAARTTWINSVRDKIWMHRDLMGLKKGDKLVADHINHDTLDNRRANLRKCTQGQNLCNRRADAGTSSKYKGVSLNKKLMKWDARISANGVQYCLGVFVTEKEAAIAYNKAAMRLHGEYALFNELIGKLDSSPF